MLKFFRKYNKYILGIGGSLLMIVFLIQPVMSMFTTNPRDMVQGTFDGGELTRGDLAIANSQLNVLGRFGLVLDRDPQQDGDQDALRFALILKDAQRLGLSASSYEIDSLMQDIKVSDADLEKIASQINATTAALRGAIRDWLIVQQYKELAAGQSHMPAGQRALLMRSMFEDPQTSLYYEALAYGSTRLSKPLVQHFLQDQGSQVAGQVVMIRANQRLDDAPDATDEQVQKLFEQYKDDLPGTGEPYGFGYRVPDRVKVEYLTVSMDEARQKVRVTEADALAYYRENKQRYTDSAGTGDTAGEPKSYDQVRDQVIQELSEQRAFEMVEEMAKDAYGLLYEDMRGMAKDEDYRLVGDAELTPLREVADKLQADFGMLPQVRAMTATWVTADKLVTLPGLGQSFLASELAAGRQVTFTQYALSAKELEPASDNPLLLHRLQVGLASTPLISLDGSRHVFRLTAAEPSRVPGSLDEVRERVAQDAKHLNAYKALLEEKSTWQERAVADGLDAVGLGGGLDGDPAAPDFSP